MIVPVSSAIKSRYYRLINSNNSFELAELHFFDSENEEVKGTWIADTATMNNPDLPVVYDNDRLSYTYINSWVGVDFGREVSLSRIEYIPRNDANGIYPGMIYELLYFDRDKWTSVDVKMANDYSITFDEVPKNALLWLRNLTEGKEERIFTYQDGKSRWL